MTLEFNVKELNYTKEQGGGSITPEGTKVITENGLYNVTTFAKASVNVEGTTPTGTTTITENGTYDVTEYASASVNVEGTEPTLITKTITVNGSYAATSDNADGYSVVSVNVSGSSPTLVTKTITENGNYNASSDNADGYSSVSVNVEPTIEALNVSPMIVPQTFTALTGTDGFSPVNISAVTSDIDSNISAGNIKSGVSILGVNGSVVELIGETKTITANGTYIPQTGNGFTSVSVNVSGGGGSQEIRGNWIVPEAYLELEEIMENDTTVDGDVYKSSIGYIINNYLPTFYIDSFASGLMTACRTSDGAFYDIGSAITHTWDTTKDLTGGYRYIIAYSDVPDFSGTGKIYFPNYTSASSITSDKNGIKHFNKYIVINSTIGNAGNFNPQLGKLTESYKFINNHGFGTLNSGLRGVIPQASSAYEQNSNVKYIPSMAELGNPTIGAMNYNSYIVRTPNYPYGLDLSLAGGDWTLGRADVSTYTCIEAYVKLPNQNVTINSSNDYFCLLSKDNWQYIATNAPTVSSKTLTMGSPNIAICGSASGTIIQTLVSKGWIVN